MRLKFLKNTDDETRVAFIAGKMINSVNISNDTEITFKHKVCYIRGFIMLWNDENKPYIFGLTDYFNMKYDDNDLSLHFSNSDIKIKIK